MARNKYYDLGRDIANSKVMDKHLVLYRPRFNLFTGSLKASLLLHQIFYWYTSKYRPFYKFKEPCKDYRYNMGDSWTEELGFTKYEFDAALKRIGVKITSGTPKTQTRQRSLVIYWTDNTRLTCYALNLRTFYTLTGIAYDCPDLLCDKDKPTYLDKNGISVYLGKPEMLSYLKELNKAAYLVSETISENDTENMHFSDPQRDDSVQDENADANAFDELHR